MLHSSSPESRPHGGLFLQRHIYLTPWSLVPRRSGPPAGAASRQDCAGRKEESPGLTTTRGALPSANASWARMCGSELNLPKRESWPILRPGACHRRASDQFLLFLLAPPDQQNQATDDWEKNKSRTTTRQARHAPTAIRQDRPPHQGPAPPLANGGANVGIAQLLATGFRDCGPAFIGRLVA